MKVNIDENVKEQLILEYSKSLPKETGGIVFGHYSDNLETAIITNIFFKGSDSESYRRSFKRGAKGFNKFSKKMWSQGEFYLGEWHTHPHSLPIMSLQDKQQMITIKNDSQYNCSEPILVIIGEELGNIKSNIYIFGSENIIIESQFWLL